MSAAKSLTLAVVLAVGVSAVYIDSSALTQCGHQALTFGDGAAPYYVAVLPAVNPCESDSIAEFHDVYGNNVDYFASLPAGTQVQLYVADANDNDAFSQIITVGGSGDYSCVDAPTNNYVPESNYYPESTGEEETTPEETTPEETVEDVADSEFVEQESEEEAASAESSTYVAPPFQVSNTNTGSGSGSGSGSGTGSGSSGGTGTSSGTPANAASSSAMTSAIVNASGLFFALVAAVVSLA